MLKYLLPLFLLSPTANAVDCSKPTNTQAPEALRVLASIPPVLPLSQKTNETTERSGCCSHHKGVCGCSYGRTVCCDGSYSPTCGCD